jgi:hypothetical protein
MQSGGSLPHLIPGRAAYAARTALGLSKEFLSLRVFYTFRGKIPFPYGNSEKDFQIW